MTQTTDRTLNIPVQFGNVGIGKESARVGFKVDATKMSDKDARFFFAGSRLTVEIVVDPEAEGDGPGQQTMGITESDPVIATCDSKSVRMTAADYGGGLTFSLAEVGSAHLGPLAQHAGKITAKRIGDAGEVPEPDDNTEGD